MLKLKLLVLCSVIFTVCVDGYFLYKKREDKTKCPQVKAIKNFDINKLLGEWYVVQYYSSSEEVPEYSCMHGIFTLSPPPILRVNMNITYRFADDPLDDILIGNITWNIPNNEQLAHWTHSEYTWGKHFKTAPVSDEGVYNTYVLDSDYTSWALLLHCAEKSGTTRYFSSFIMSRQPNLGPNVISYLREKLPRYDIDLEYMFPMNQTNCDKQSSITPTLYQSTLLPNLKLNRRKHPLKRNRKTRL